MKVRITKRHIAEGVCADARRCPIALALIDRFGGQAHVGVGVEVRGVRHTLTTEAARFIEAFDACRPVSPGWLTVWE